MEQDESSALSDALEDQPAPAAALTPLDLHRISKSHREGERRKQWKRHKRALVFIVTTLAVTAGGVTLYLHQPEAEPWGKPKGMKGKVRRALDPRKNAGLKVPRSPIEVKEIPEDLPSIESLQAAWRKGQQGKTLTPEEEWNIALVRKLAEEERRGTLTSEQEEYFARGKVAFSANGGRRKRTRGQKARRQPKKPTNAGESSTVGLTPIIDLEGDYKGQSGGLYGKGENEPPPALARALVDQTKLVHPLSKDGKPSPDGVIGFLGLGSALARQMFTEFRNLAERDPTRSPRLKIIAHRSLRAALWSDESDDELIEAAGLHPNQIQIVWLNRAPVDPKSLGPWPKHVKVHEKQLEKTVRRLRKKYPNLRLCYLSSRIYAGHSARSPNPEPFAYESAFGVRDLILRQIGRDPRLNWAPDRGPVQAPLLVWGPYLWSNGTKPRMKDLLVWEAADFANRILLSPQGLKKAGTLLVDYFRGRPDTVTWYLNKNTKR